MTKQELDRVTHYFDNWKELFDDNEAYIEEDSLMDVKEFYNKVKNIYINSNFYSTIKGTECAENRFMYDCIPFMIPELSLIMHDPMTVLEKLQHICIWYPNSVDVRYHEYDTQTGKYIYSFPDNPNASPYLVIFNCYLEDCNNEPKFKLMDVYNFYWKRVCKTVKSLEEE